MVANVCALLAHGILIAMVSPSIRSCDCVCPFMNWFPWAHTFLWAPFLNIFTSHFRIRLFHIEKSVEKSRSNCLYLMCNIWCAVCGSVWTKNSNGSNRHTHIFEGNRKCTTTKTCFNLYSSGFKLHVLANATLHHSTALLSLPLCPSSMRARACKRKWWVNVCMLHIHIDEYGSIDREWEKKRNKLTCINCLKRNQKTDTQHKSKRALTFSFFPVRSLHFCKDSDFVVVVVIIIFDFSSSIPPLLLKNL